MLRFVIPVVHQISCNERVLILNRENAKRKLLSQVEYNQLLNAIGQDRLKHGNYEVFEENPVSKVVFECIITGVFYVKGAQMSPKAVINNSVGNPRVVYLYMTAQCNMRCVYCYENAECISTLHDSPDINIHLVKQLLDKLVAMDVQEIVFTGGEPMLVSGIFEVASYAKKLGMRTCLLTNGTLISAEVMEKFCCFDIVKISLDSIDPYANEQTRGKGSTERIIRGMKLVKRCGIKLIVECVINKSNFASIEDTIEVLYNRIGVDHVRFTYMMSVGRGSGSALLLKIPYDVSYEHIIRAHIRVLGSRYAEILDDLIHAETKLFSGCGAGINEIMVNCDGSTYPCRMFHNDQYYMGNLFQETLQEMQQKRNFLDFRESIMVDEISGCKDCTLKYLCAGGCRPAHYGFTGDYKTNYNEWCLMTHKNLEYMLWVREGIDPFTGKSVNLIEDTS